jgi:hypothetical protein
MQQVLWQANEQVEQDLVICRELVGIFFDEWLKIRLAFSENRGLIRFEFLYFNEDLHNEPNENFVCL